MTDDKPPFRYQPATQELPLQTHVDDTSPWGVGECPFCGNAATTVLRLDVASLDCVAIACDRCGAVGPPAPIATASSAFAAWNQRTHSSTRWNAYLGRVQAANDCFPSAIPLN